MKFAGSLTFDSQSIEIITRKHSLLIEVWPFVWDVEWLSLAGIHFIAALGPFHVSLTDEGV